MYFLFRKLLDLVQLLLSQFMVIFKFKIEMMPHNRQEDRNERNKYVFVFSQMKLYQIHTDLAGN